MSGYVWICPDCMFSLYPVGFDGEYWCGEHGRVAAPQLHEKREAGAVNADPSTTNAFSARRGLPAA